MTNLLLTGAGFTKNFGGLLASEMWYKIFNSIDSAKYPELKDKINQFRQGYDFEGFYNEIINGNYDEPVKDLTKDITYKAYLGLDNILQEWISNDSSRFPISNSLLSKFLSQFKYFFTTNQDLFIERKLLEPLFFCPGAEDNTIFRNKLNLERDINNLKIRLPTKYSEDDLEKFLQGNSRAYIKLHGSFNWLSGNNNDFAMVIGSQKDKQIEKEPLLKQYLKLFERQLQQRNVHLVTIGYGFKDQHLNSKIEEALNNHGLKLFVISPLDLDLWGSKIIPGIVENIEGYFKHSLLDLFPLHGNGLQLRQELKSILGLVSYTVG